MGFVYLIGNRDLQGKYKIGSTRGKSVDRRLKQLQTGNSSELFIKEAFETEHPFKLEKMLHNRFKSSSLMGEWFELSESDTEAFKGICEEKMKVIESLKDNPFYFNVRIESAKASDFGNGSIYSQEQMKALIDDFNVRLKEFGNVLGELNNPII